MSLSPVPKTPATAFEGGLVKSKLTCAWDYDHNPTDAKNFRALHQNSRARCRGASAWLQDRSWCVQERPRRPWLLLRGSFQRLLRKKNSTCLVAYINLVSKLALVFFTQVIFA